MLSAVDGAIMLAGGWLVALSQKTSTVFDGAIMPRAISCWAAGCTPLQDFDSSTSSGRRRSQSEHGAVLAKFVLNSVARPGHPARRSLAPRCTTQRSQPTLHCV